MAKKRIAILGGGMSSLVTAFELTSRPGWNDDLDITVYQTGFRLGGKGASGRNPDVYDRIEEHGLHIMFGFYDNVFRVMKQAYSELGRAPSQPLSTWEEAFKPHDLIVMMEKVGEEYLPWEVSPPRNDIVPGTEGLLMGPFDFLVKLLEHSVKRFHTWTEKSAHAELAAASRKLGYEGDLDAVRTQMKAIVGAGEAVVAEGTGLVESLEHALWHAVKLVFSGDVRAVVKSVKGEFAYLDLAHGLARTGPGFDQGKLDPGEPESIGWLLRRFLEWLWKEVEDVSIEFRRLRIELDFALTLALGMIEDDLILPPVDWFKIDQWDFRAWLEHHGARPETIQSPIVDGLYDAIFSTDAPMAAGTIVHLLLCMGFTYKTAVNFKMQAGMGDTVFTPLYLTLKRRGVRFEFFNCVNEIKLSADKKRVERIEIGVQATLKKEYPTYDPLVMVKDLASWPSVPRYEQLEQGEELRKKQVDLEDWWTDWPDVGKRTLVVGQDFDVCVLGISVGAFKYICKDMIDDVANPRFKTMVDAIATCQTAAAQLWFAPDLAQTGWSTQSKQLPITIPYVEPLDTWCDMSQLIVRETWPPSLPVGSCHYLCSNLKDIEPMPPRDHHDYAKRQNQRVHDITVTWLEENVHWLWPKATMPASKTELNWWWLVDPRHQQQGTERFNSQYWHAPTSPSERYNLSVPTSSWARLRADESGYANLVLTGDWTLTSLSAGCLEAATMSGIASANAVDGGKRRIWNDWLPASGPIGPGRESWREARPAPAPARPAAEYSRKPAFIPRDGQLMATPPISMKTTLYMFMLDADMDAIRAMCDQYLNLGGKTVYRPLLPFVLLYCSYAESAPVEDPIGWCPEKDFGFWVPVVKGRVEGPLFIPEKMQVFTPYLWVDSGVAMVGGREVYGFPKEYGTMTMPADPSQPARFTVDTLVIPHYSPESKTVDRRILEVGKVGGGVWDVLKQIWNDGETVLKAIEELLHQHGPGRIPVPDGQLALQFLREVGRELPMVFLKQFPDVEDGNKACYQAVVEAPVAITSGITGGWIPGEYGINLWSFDSHQIVKNLGLRVTKQEDNKSELRSLAHGWVKFDGLVKGGKIVYEKK